MFDWCQSVASFRFLESVSRALQEEGASKWRAETWNMVSVSCGLFRFWPNSILFALCLGHLRACSACQDTKHALKIKIHKMCLPCLDPVQQVVIQATVYLAMLGVSRLYFSRLSNLFLRPSEEALTRTGKLLESALDVPGMRLTRALRDLRRLCEAERDFFGRWKFMEPGCNLSLSLSLSVAQAMKRYEKAEKVQREESKRQVHVAFPVNQKEEFHQLPCLCERERESVCFLVVLMCVKLADCLMTDSLAENDGTDTT